MRIELRCKCGDRVAFESVDRVDAAGTLLGYAVEALASQWRDWHADCAQDASSDARDWPELKDAFSGRDAQRYRLLRKGFVDADVLNTGKSMGDVSRIASKDSALDEALDEKLRERGLTP